MHGLIFETSICYWQDQPGRPPVAQRRGPRSGAGRGVARQRTGAARPRRARRGGGPCGVCWTVGRGSPTNPGRRECYRRGASAPFPASRFGRRSARRGKRVRENESPGAPSEAAGTSAQSPREGRPTSGRSLGRPVGGLLWQTGRLGLARPGSAAEGPEETVLSERGSSAPGRARRLQAASAERVCRRGPCKRRATISFRSVVARRGATRAPCFTMVRFRCAPSA